ncbi:MAG TPA: response regulator [Alphaproteobacteria bacterium]|nr:response regulator [Alphaproteobacteria bacterium]
MSESPKPRILIVDDEGANARALCDTLRGKGYETEGFTSGPVALDALGPGKYELLLADLMMPELDGIDLLRAAQRIDPDLVGIIMTGEGTVETAVEAMKSGAIDFILKPFKLSAILPVLERALTIRRLRIDNAALECSLRQRTVELEAALRDLEAETAERLKAEQALLESRKMEAIGQLTGGVAHDFNNLLTALLGNLELALDKDIGEEASRLVRNAVMAGERGARITSQLLAFGRRQALSIRAVDVNELILGIKDMLASSVTPAIGVELSLTPDLWPALADSRQIELALMNLVLNARDAMPAGGRLTIETANLGADDPDRPENIDAEAGDCVSLSVRDTGSGMSEDVKARAFEPFFTTKEIGKGTGLGLSMVYGLVRQLGGAARIVSKPGEGATVSLILRRAPAGAAEPTELASRSDGADHSPIRVLFVDDEALVRTAIAAALREDGHEVTDVGSAAAALTILGRGDHLDVLVVDLLMPGMNGAELAVEARRQRPDLPVVIITGYAGDMDRRIEEQGYPVLRKPFRPVELATILAKARPPRPSR